jgi:hypothetical protein
MPFASDMADLVAKQLSRFVTLNRHQLAGQVANLDFWIEEVHHALKVIDGYGERFKSLKRAQAKHVAEHHTTAFALDDPCCTQSAPAQLRRVSDAELREARRALCDAAYRFLVRCFKEGLITDARLRAACETLGVSIDRADLTASERRRPSGEKRGASG